MLLTGESEDVPKKYNAAIHPAGAGKPAKLTASNLVFSSTTITAGNARGIVVETGMNTRVGSIAALHKPRAARMRLQRRSGYVTRLVTAWPSTEAHASTARSTPH
ncbi:E1-E2 ATPase [Phytophthora infestans]|uniref:E1-E2 ATPase n=1 Tax=Phytophthora infestans TaxID=4787 RepID=A0A8S9V264_PHYIN|nr:E1-E2 ATPase [Phytophthora infestans]